METKKQPKPGRVLIVGATGFVGRRLIPELVKKNVPLRLLARKPAGLSNGVLVTSREVMRGLQLLFAVRHLPKARTAS